MATNFPGQFVTDAWLAGIPLAHIVSKMDDDGYSEDLVLECMELYESLEEWHVRSMQTLQAHCPHDWREF